MAASAVPKEIKEDVEDPEDSKTKGSYLDFLDMNRNSSSFEKKNLILDEQRFEDMFLKCQNCKERYGSGMKTPKIIPCHHSFCIGCLKSLFDKESDYRMALTGVLRSAPTAVTLYCPTCKNSFIATSANIQEYPTDHRVVQLLDFVLNTETCTTNMCSNHIAYPLNFFCETCFKPICRECTSSTHKESDGHVLQDLVDALKTYTPKVDSTIAELESNVTSLLDKQDTIERASADLELCGVTLRGEIENAFESLRIALNERESRLVDLSREKISVERGRLSKKVEFLKTRREKSQELAEMLKTAKEDKNVEDLFKSHREVKAERRLSEGSQDSDDEMTTTFSFSSREDKNLATRISTFGDIATHTQTPSVLVARGVSMNGK